MSLQWRPRLVFPILHLPPAGTRAVSPAQWAIVAVGTYHLGNLKRDCAKAEGLIFLCTAEQSCLERLSFNPHADYRSFCIRPTVNKQEKML